MGGIIIHGIECLLGSYFAARYLQAPGNRVFYRTNAKDRGVENEIAGRVVYAWRKMAGEEQAGITPQDLDERLCRFNEDGRSGEAAAYWYFNSPALDVNARATLQDVLLACGRFGARELNYVEYDCVDCDPPEAAKEQVAVAALARAQGIPFRAFWTSLLAGAGDPGVEQHTILLSLLKVLHSIKAEIEERSPQYFDFHALRYIAPPDATLNLVPVSFAADLLLRIAETPATLGSQFNIASPARTPLMAFCERVGIAYGLGLLGVSDTTALNAVDRIFHERMVGLERYFVKEPAGTSNADTKAAATLPDLLFGEEEQITLLESLRRDQDEYLTAWRRRAQELPGRLARQTITAGGSELTYYAGGAGPAVVVLNALGQGLECWYRLLDKLLDHYRVIIWEPRGTTAPPPPFGLVEQVSDVEAVLRHEGIESCHLLGWCTGPKVAMKFCLGHPSAVRSMAFLNTTLKCDGSPEELDSPYEKNLESLCRGLARKPAMAPMVMNTFRSRSATDETEMLESPDGEQVSVAVLSRMNGNLKSYVLAPFRTEATTVNYARQLIDFWACDVRAQASMISVPVLLISAEYDQIATPAASREAAILFPNARSLCVKGATHYCLYDRPEFVAGLLKQFFEHPDGIPALPVQDEEFSRPACACSETSSASAASV
jgi:pimeloyl-ACP methyl ester carboxylesterase